MEDGPVYLPLFLWKFLWKFRLGVATAVACVAICSCLFGVWGALLGLPAGFGLGVLVELRPRMVWDVDWERWHYAVSISAGLVLLILLVIWFASAETR